MSDTIAMLPFSVAREVNGLVYFSGAIPIDDQNNVVNESLQAEVAQTMKNIQSDLEMQQLSFEDIVDVSVYLKDINDVEEFNQYYLSYFQDPMPTRVLVGGVDLVFGVRVELRVVAQRPDAHSG